MGATLNRAETPRAFAYSDSDRGGIARPVLSHRGMIDAAIHTSSLKPPTRKKGDRVKKRTSERLGRLPDTPPGEIQAAHHIAPAHVLIFKYRAGLSCANIRLPQEGPIYIWVRRLDRYKAPSEMPRFPGGPTGLYTNGSGLYQAYCV